MPTLAPPTNAELKALCRALWDWEKFCKRCPDASTDDLANPLCPDEHCPWKARFQRRQPFFNFYKSCTANYASYSARQAVLRDHYDLIEIITYLKTCPTTNSRTQSRKQYFQDRDPNNQIYSDHDQDRAFLLAARVMTMVAILPEPSISPRPPEGLKVLPLITFPDAVCLPEQSFHTAVSGAFEKQQVNPDSELKGITLNIKNNLRAVNLIKQARLKIKGTNELRNHLMLDHESGAFFVFHHIGFLRENLLSTRDPQPNDVGPFLPREVALEALSTIEILFPPYSSDGTRDLLKKLIREQKFDADALRDETGLCQREGEQKQIETGGFPFWSARLLELNKEMESPKSRTWFAQWLAWKGRSYGDAVIALVGVFVALIFSLMALLVGIFQAVIAWNQWKYPVSPQGGQKG